MFDDFIVDDHAWTIRYIVINTRNWLPGKKILVAAQWITTVDLEKLQRLRQPFARGNKERA